MTKEELGSLKEVLDEARTEWLQTVAKADVEDSSEEEVLLILAARKLFTLQDITDDRFMCLHWRLEVKERWRNTLKVRSTNLYPASAHVLERVWQGQRQ